MIGSKANEIQLSPHQLRIGGMVALGYTNREIASEIGASVQAVKSALHTIFDKIGLWNRVELVNYFAHHPPSNGHSNREQTDAAERLESSRLSLVNDITVDYDSVKIELDALVFVAAALCKVPIALISIVEARRLWFCAEQGMGIKVAKRHASFCEHAIQQSDLFEVQDAANDVRFQKHPMVVSEPHIRFYAGVPLITCDGHALGTLCVIDRSPNKLDQVQQEGLKRLGRVVMSLLPALRLAQVASRSEELTLFQDATIAE